jgi:small subunit ribosomal protein S17
MGMNSETRQTKKTRQGVVLKNKMDKTVVVEVTRRFRHRKYGKFIRTRLRYAAHDADNSCEIGDVVLIEETRPLSKTKRWRVKEIVQKTVGV